MLTHIEIEGFKSFGTPAAAVDVTPLTFLVGPNASGKSNFLAALEFLQTAVRHDVETAIAAFGRRFGGMEQTSARAGPVRSVTHPHP